MLCRTCTKVPSNSCRLSFGRTIPARICSRLLDSVWDTNTFSLHIDMLRRINVTRRIFKTLACPAIFHVHLWLSWLIWSTRTWSIDLLWLLASDRESLSLFGPMRTGDGLSTGRKEKLGESALDNDSGVPTELIVPGSGLDSASNLQRKIIELQKLYYKLHYKNIQIIEIHTLSFLLYLEKLLLW